MRFKYNSLDKLEAETGLLLSHGVPTYIIRRAKEIIQQILTDFSLKPSEELTETVILVSSKEEAVEAKKEIDDAEYVDRRLLYTEVCSIKSSEYGIVYLIPTRFN
jgi:hypothetical protein